MDVTVKSINSSDTATFKVESTDTVLSLKRKVSARFDVDVNLLRLTFAGHLMQNDDTFSSLHLIDGSTIHALFSRVDYSGAGAGANPIPQMIYCPKGHLLYPMTLSDLRKRPSGYRGGYICDSCQNGSCAELYHCDLCNYDLCRPCGTTATEKCHCPEKHQLLRLTQDDMAAWNKRNPNWECSMCHCAPSVPFMISCVGCKYNVCPSCYKKEILESGKKNGSRGFLH